MSTGVSGKGVSWAEVQMGRPDFWGPDSACTGRIRAAEDWRGGMGTGSWAGVGGPDIHPGLATADSVTLPGLRCPGLGSRLGTP